MPAGVESEEITRLREDHYNATVISIRRIHGDLMILRVLPDQGPIKFQPGQYTLLGLGVWEPRADRIPHHENGEKLVRRVRAFFRLHWQGALIIREKLRLNEEAFHLLLAGLVGVIGGATNLAYHACNQFIKLIAYQETGDFVDGPFEAKLRRNPDRMQLQLTHVQEQGARDLSNDRIQLAAEVEL